MLLRVSGQTTGAEIDMSAINGTVQENSGIAYAAELVAFAEAVLGDDEAAPTRERAALRSVLTPEAFVDTFAVIGAFNVVDRIADSTGISLDPPMAAMSEDLRTGPDLARFRSSANTPPG